MFERAARELGRLRADGEVAPPLGAALLTRSALVRLLSGASVSRGEMPPTPTDNGETRVRGIGGEWGIDSTGGLGSADMIKEWGYPDVGLVICEMPSAGHDAVMLDYRECGAEGEPAVVYVDEDRQAQRIACSFSELIDGLVSCRDFQP